MNNSIDMTAYATQAMRDLAWVLQSPSLVRSRPQLPTWQFPQTAAERVTNLQSSSVTCEALTNFLTTRWRSGRVGDYFELLVHFALEQLCGFELLASHQQVFVAGKTMGELDFVFRDQLGSIVHLESSVKFFLFHPQRSEATRALPEEFSGADYVGPNPVDNLESKLRRLESHQLPLSRQVRNDIDERRVLVRGSIFYHPSSGLVSDDANYCSTANSATRRAQSTLLNEQHLSGLWLRRSEVGWLEEFASKVEAECETPDTVRLCLLRKPFWLSSPMASNSSENATGENATGENATGDGRPHSELVPAKKLVPLLRNTTRTELVSIMSLADSNCCDRTASDGAGVYQEVERCFVVSDAWPTIES